MKRRVQRVSNSFNPMDIDKTVEKSRNRVERRTCVVFTRKDQIKSLGSPWSEYIKAIIKVERTTTRLDTKLKSPMKVFEESYYVSTVRLTAREFNQVIRKHWSIENSHHRVKDYTLEEDRSRVRIKPENLSYLRNIALNILRQNKVENIRNAIYRNSLNIDKTINSYFLDSFS